MKCLLFVSFHLGKIQLRLNPNDLSRRLNMCHLSPELCRGLMWQRSGLDLLSIFHWATSDDFHAGLHLLSWKRAMRWHLTLTCLSLCRPSRLPRRQRTLLFLVSLVMDELLKVEFTEMIVPPPNEYEHGQILHPSVAEHA